MSTVKSFPSETAICSISTIKVYVENFSYSYKIDDFTDDGSANLTDALYLGTFTPHCAE